MSLLSALPHEATIRRRSRSKDSLGGSKDSFTNEQTKVKCWEQQASSSEVTSFAKRGMSITTKIFFSSDPNVSSKHQILITKRNGTAVASPVPMSVQSEPFPDASAGLGKLWRVMVGRVTSEED